MGSNARAFAWWSRLCWLRRLRPGELALLPGVLDSECGVRPMRPQIDAYEVSGASPPEYLTAAQVATMLQVDEKTVYRWAAEDSTMPALRLGRGRGTVRFQRERLLRWLADREQGRRRRAVAAAS